MDKLDILHIERLIRISKEKPLDADSFVPWGQPFGVEEKYLPENLVSLAGLGMYETLSGEQKNELARLELIQVMYSYCWSEGLFCTFMNRYILDLPSDNIERRFLIRELIEEYKHQEMFGRAIETLGGKPIPVNGFQRIAGNFTARYMPDGILFLACITIEMMADRYGDVIRKDLGCYSVIRKVSELHNIEEARHILFTKALLKRYTENMNPLKASWYSLIVLMNIRLFQDTYVKKEIYERIGLADSKGIRRVAFRNYQRKFAEDCLGTVVELVKGFGGFNGFTRLIWRYVLKITVNH